MTLKRVPYSDSEGKKFMSVLPDDVDDREAARGLLEGPPELRALGLPTAVEARLHNELFARGILTARDARRSRQDVIGALMAALRVDAEAIITAYSQNENNSSGGI